MNEDRKLTKHGAERLAAFLRTLRTDWDEPGIITALGKAKQRGDAYQIAIGAVRAAADPSNRTPAVIALDGRHWRPPTPDDTAEQIRTPDTSTLEGRCPKCGFWRVRGENHRCQRPADPDTVAAARAAIKDGSTT